MPERRMKRHAVTQPLDQSIRLIPLTKGQNAIVDAADFDWVSQFNWCAIWNKNTRTFYAQRRILGGPTVRMHRFILDTKNEERVDHKNRDTLDNRRSNLRKASCSQNQCNRDVQINNTSGFRGVSWYKRKMKWEAYIQVAGKKKRVGYFTNSQEAARAYDKAAGYQYGAFAQFNFPQSL